MTSLSSNLYTNSITKDKFKQNDTVISLYSSSHQDQVYEQIHIAQQLADRGQNGFNYMPFIGFVNIDHRKRHPTENITFGKDRNSYSNAREPDLVEFFTWHSQGVLSGSALANVIQHFKIEENVAEGSCLQTTDLIGFQILKWSQFR
jgi:hypothetical protein